VRVLASLAMVVVFASADALAQTTPTDQQGNDDDGVVRAGEAGAVDNPAGAGAGREPAAVQPDDHRTLAAVLQAWREHIQQQTVFALRRGCRA